MLVLALHLLLLLLQPAPPPARQGPTTPQAVLQLRLIAPPPTMPVPEADPPAARQAPRAAAIAADPFGPAEPLAITVPPLPAPHASAPVAPAPPSPLDLRLPAPALRGVAPPSPAPESRPRSVESTLERDFGGAPLVQENLGDGRIRLRKGRRCLEFRDARIAQLDPFNQSVRPVPKQVEDCSR
jgi:hypothetical protein